MKAGATRKKESHVWERDEYDWYVEPASAAEALFKVEEFTGGIWDPACGGGNIVGAAISAGITAMGTDIVDRNPVDPPWWKGELDFLLFDIVGKRPRNIVANPPFYRGRGTEAFIRKALAVVEGKVAIFAPITFLSGTGRAEGLFTDYPPSRMWVLHPRVSCPPGEHLLAGGKAEGGTEDWCWMVWDPDAGGKTELRWLKVEK